MAAQAFFNAGGKPKAIALVILALALTGCDGVQDVAKSANQEFFESFIGHDIKRPPDDQYECEYGKRYEDTVFDDRIVDLDADYCQTKIQYEALGGIEVAYYRRNGIVISAHIRFDADKATWMEEQLTLRVGSPSDEESVPDYADLKHFQNEVDSLEFLKFLEPDNDYRPRLSWLNNKGQKKLLANIPLSDLEKKIPIAKEECTAALKSGLGYRAARWKDENGPWEFSDFDREDSRLDLYGADIELFSTKSREWVDGGFVTCRYWPDQDLADIEVSSPALFMEKYR